MPNPVKPCVGRFSESTIEILRANVDRAQWLPHNCEECGQLVGAVPNKGSWSPEQHWPSVSRRRKGQPPVAKPPVETDGQDETEQTMAGKHPE